jgi:hypothetical protein
MRPAPRSSLLPCPARAVSSRSAALRPDRTKHDAGGPSSKHTGHLGVDVTRIEKWTIEFNLRAWMRCPEWLRRPILGGLTAAGRLSARHVLYQMIDPGNLSATSAARPTQSGYGRTTLRLGAPGAGRSGQNGSISLAVVVGRGHFELLDRPGPTARSPYNESSGHFAGAATGQKASLE